MADFGGFQVKTPQEVLAEMNAQRQQIAQLPPAQQRNANIQFQIANMFGNKELNQARSTEQAITKATENVPEGMGNLDSEKTRLVSIYNAIKDVDPVAASQISSRLIAVDEAMFERQRLKAIDARAEIASGNQAAESEARQTRLNRDNIFDTPFYVFSQDAAGTKRMQGFDSSDPEQMAAYNAALQEEGAIAVNRKEAAEHALRTEGMKDLYNKSAISKKVNGIVANGGSYRRGTSLINILATNPFANTDTAGFMGYIADKSQEVRAGLAKTGEIIDGISESKAMQNIEAFLDAEGLFTGPDAQDRATMVGMTLNMAYTLARSLDPSGRLSDADVQFAAKMIAASRGSPGILARVLTETLSRTYDDMNSLVGNDVAVNAANDTGQQALLRRHWETSRGGYAEFMDAVTQSELFDMSSLSQFRGSASDPNEPAESTQPLTEDANVDVGF